VTQRRRRCQSKTAAASDITERNLCSSNSRARHNQHLEVLDQARARAQVKPGCDSLGRHARVLGKPSSRCCAVATTATNSRGAVARLIGGERFGTCAHLLAGVVGELVHAHMYVHAHGAEASGATRRKSVGGELVDYGLLLVLGCTAVLLAWVPAQRGHGSKPRQRTMQRY
jgi:hypothetical protein